MKHKLPYRIKNATGSGPTEILIYEKIGADYWSNDGITAKAFAADLRMIPEGQEIFCRINSEGGNVWDGLAIYSQLSRRREHVTCIVDGVAASIAGVIAEAGRTLQMPRNALLMLHNPRTYCEGDSEDMTQMAATLDAHKKAIASVYVEKTGKNEEEIYALMDEETWMTGEEAQAEGFADDVMDAVVITASADRFSMYRHVPGSINGGKPASKQQLTNQMSKPNTGTTGPQNAGGGQQTPQNIVTHQEPSAPQNAAPPVIAPPVAPTHATPTVVLDDSRLRTIEAKFAAQRLQLVTNAVDSAIREHRIPVAQRDRWITRGVADETDGVITDLASMPPVLPGTAPVGAVEILNESGVNLGNEVIRLKGRERGAFYNTHRERIRGHIVNANTMPSQLQRAAILQEAIRAFSFQLMPLTAFSTVFRDTPLEGTDTIEVPYYALQGTASTDFVAANGYVMGNTATSYKEITVNKRKYQAIAITSSERRRQPYLKIEELTLQAANKLAYDMLVDVLSVITNANFGAAAHTGAAANFDSVDVADLKGVCDVAKWPVLPRSLVLSSAYDVNLLKDSSIKAALNFGGAEAIRDGRIPKLMGFDYHVLTVIPGNSENLTGFAVYPSGIIVGSSPIQPTDQVRQQLTTYEQIVHPGSGATLEHRVWGNPDYDNTREVIEVNYGYAAGEAAAVKRIVSA